MTDRELKEIQYEAFFDELMGIQKEAGWTAVKGALGGGWRGAKAIAKNPMESVQAMQQGWKAGVKQVGKDVGRKATPWQKAWGGAKGVAGTNPGKALIGGGALALGGAGALGAGVGRVTAPRQ